MLSNTKIMLYYISQPHTLQSPSTPLNAFTHEKVALESLATRRIRGHIEGGIRSGIHILPIDTEKDGRPGRWVGWLAGWLSGLMTELGTETQT